MEHFYQNTIGENWFTYPELYGFIPDHFGEGAVFVEVGVWKGRSICHLAVEVINQNKNQKIYAVDTWSTQDYIDLSGKNPTEEDELYNTYLKNIEPVKDYITSIRSFSVEAAKQFEDKSIDFIFIDAAHDYENVKKDILAWLPKIKDTGIIAGHDYVGVGDVKRAVDEIFDSSKLTFPADRTWMYNILSNKI
jgi:hypothetical protein